MRKNLNLLKNLPEKTEKQSSEKLENFLSLLQKMAYRNLYTSSIYSETILKIFQLYQKLKRG